MDQHQTDKIALLERRVADLEDHLARETRSSQAANARAEDYERQLRELAEQLTTAQALRDRHAAAYAEIERTLAASKVDDHARNETGARLCAAAMVLRRRADTTLEVLLLRRGPSASYGAGAWTLPAGGVSPGDANLAATAARELREETGLLFAPREVVRLVDGLTPTTGGRPFACAIVLGSQADPEQQARNLEPDTHDLLGWYSSSLIPVETWDRAMIRAVMAMASDSAR